MNTKEKTNKRGLDEADAKPTRRPPESPLTWDEHIVMAKQIYGLADALRAFMERYRKSHPARKRVASAMRCLSDLRCELDSAFCNQFPENPRPAGPDFMDSPYISAAIDKGVDPMLPRRLHALSLMCAQFLPSNLRA